jgi:DNA-binding GntR family transcriptional regulator
MPAAPVANPGAGERALNALEQLLHTQREAIVSGDLGALQAAHARIHALLKIGRAHV